MKKKRMVLSGLMVLAGILFLASFCLGRFPVPLDQVVRILWNALMSKLTGGRIRLAQTWEPAMATVVLNIRMPRILMALLVGAALSMAGAAFQGMFQNPMASPDILGASSGAGFGAALAILWGFSASGIMGSAFLCSILTVALVFLIAAKAPGLPVLNLILAGIMVGSLVNAGLSWVKLVADPGNQLPAITYWLMGSLSGVKKEQIVKVLVPMVPAMAGLLVLRWRINLLTQGEDEARAMGVRTGMLRLVVILCATLLTAASISVSGMIGWVGLVVPHMARKLVGDDYRYLFPASALCGGCFLLIVDNLSRNLTQSEIPIGILTAFIGAPFFLYLLLRRKRG